MLMFGSGNRSLNKAANSVRTGEPSLSSGPQDIATRLQMSADLTRRVINARLDMSWLGANQVEGFLRSERLVSLRQEIAALCHQFAQDPDKVFNELLALKPSRNDAGPLARDTAIRDAGSKSAAGMTIAKVRYGDTSPDRKLAGSSSLRKVERGEALSVLHSAAVPPALRTLIMQARQNLQGVPASNRFAKMCEPTQIRAMEGIASLRKTIGAAGVAALSGLLA